MHALTWHQSGGEPWAFSVSGQHHPQVLKSIEDAVRDTQPDTVVMQVGLTACRAHLDPSRRRCSPHAPTLPRAHARSRSSSSCAEPPPAPKETRTTAPLRPTTDRGSGPTTALPTGFWRPLPKATHPISRCRKARGTTADSRRRTEKRRSNGPFDRHSAARR